LLADGDGSYSEQVLRQSGDAQSSRLLSLYGTATSLKRQLRDHETDLIDAHYEATGGVPNVQFEIVVMSRVATGMSRLLRSQFLQQETDVHRPRRRQYSGLTPSFLICLLSFGSIKSGRDRP